MSHHKKPEHHIRPYKITAQTAGLVACIFILFFIAGKGVPDILKNEENALVPFIPLLILPVSGYLVSWYREITGAVIMTAGGIILLAFFLLKGDSTMGMVYGLPFILAGLLYGVHIFKREKLRKHV